AKVVLVEWFQNETIWLDGLCLAKGRFIRMRGHKNNRNIEILPDPITGLNTGHPSCERDIQDDDVWLSGLRILDALRTSRCHTRYFIAELSQHPLYEESSSRIVFNNQNPVTHRIHFLLR